MKRKKTKKPTKCPDEPNGNEGELHNFTENYSSREEIVAFAIASGKPFNQITEEYSLSRKTLYNWLEKPEFQKLVAQHRKQLVGEASHAAIAQMNQSVQTMRALMESAGMETVRLAAAKSLWEIGHGAHEMFDLKGKIDELESWVEEQKAKGL